MTDLPNPEVAILNAALELPASQRADYLDDACAGNAALRGQVEALLQAHEQAGGFLEAPPAGLDFQRTVRVDIPLTEKPGDKIGRYKLLQQIGEGGCGVVYMAEQEEPVRRRVALKVIKLGMDTKQVIARFEAERQALALMDHPNIAKVLDAGATDTGRPYFVMELVKGIRITDYCDQNNLSTGDRLDLFIKVCHAIQHAHQKGIIHRDIKPSNVLVTLHDGVPVPKIIDFGIAKATEQKLTDKTVFTAFGQFIGTPAYMSPEQAELSGLDIDTRSDIYALGVLLYELLTGKTPFDPEALLRAGLDEMRRIIREDEPPRPSTRLSTLSISDAAELAKHRKERIAALINVVRGDLDWIVMKCLEKDRTRRYETANGVAMDLQRYLHDEPVIARPPSTSYRLQKFVRKHRGPVAAAAGFVALLAVSTALSTMLAVWANRERDSAVKAREAEKGARQAEAAQRELAEKNAHDLRRRSYSSDMNLAQQAFKASRLGRAKVLLERNRPKTGETDLRHWEWRYLWSQCQSDAISTLIKHDRLVGSLGISPNGKWLAWDAYGMVKIWDLATRRAVTSLEDLQDQGQEVKLAFSPTGDRLAATSLPGVIKLWEVGTWNSVMELHHGGDVQSLSFSQDGRLLAVFGLDQRVSLWSLERTNLIAAAPVSRPSGGSKGVAVISPNNQWLAVGETDGLIRLLEIPTLVERLRFVGSVEGITTLAFSPDGQILASASGYAALPIRLWNPVDGTSAGRLEGHTGYVRQLAFSPDGKVLASTGYQTVDVWDVHKQAKLIFLRGHLRGPLAVAFSPDGQTLISGGKDGEILLWNANQRQSADGLATLPGVIAEVTVSPDSQTLATRNGDRSVSLWNLATLEETRRLTDLGTNNSGVCFSPTGRLLAVGGSSGVKLLDPAKAGEVGRIRADEGALIRPVGFTADGRLLLCQQHGPPLGSYRFITNCSLWSVSSTERLAAWSVPFGRNQGNTFRAGFSPDGRFAGTGDTSGQVRIWDVVQGREVALLAAHPNWVSGIAFSPDSTLFATSSEDGEAKLWTVATLTNHANLHAQVGSVHSVAFSPDGRRLATGNGGRDTVLLFDVATHQEVAALSGQGYIGLQFSPDGNTVLAISNTGTLHLWRAPSFEQIELDERRAQPKATIR